MASASRDPSKKGSVSGPNLIPAGELAGRPPIPLTRPIIVAGSRNNCRLHLISRTVSKAHSLIVVTRHSVFVRDLASREGTFVNGEKIGECDLSEGDILKIGRFEFIFSSGGAKLKPHREKTAPPAVIFQPGSDVPPVPLEGRVALIGRRGSADIAFVEQTVSTAHAVIVAWEGKRYIRDLGSRTGTFVNGKQVHQQEIQPLDQIRVGDSELVYEISTPGEGVEVVASATDSAVATAISAQEIEAVPLTSDDTATPAEKPKVAAPATRPVRPSTPVRLEDSIAEEIEPRRPAKHLAAEAPAVVATTESPLADSIAGLEIDDQTEPATSPPDDILSRRGWHRGSTEPEAETSIASEQETPLTPFDLPAEEPAPEPHLDLEPLAAAAEAIAVDAAKNASDGLQSLVPPAAELDPASPVVEVVEGTDADTAQPLETVAPVGDDLLVVAPEPAVDLTDTVFTREVKALTDTNVGEPVEVAAHEPTADDPAAATDEPIAVETAASAIEVETDRGVLEGTTHATLSLPVADSTEQSTAEAATSVESDPALAIEDSAIASVPVAPVDVEDDTIEFSQPVAREAEVAVTSRIELEADAETSVELPAIERPAPVTFSSPKEVAAADDPALEEIALAEPTIELPESSPEELDSLVAPPLEVARAEPAPTELSLQEPAAEVHAAEPAAIEVEATIAPPPEMAPPVGEPEPVTTVESADAADATAATKDVGATLDESAIEDLLAGEEQPTTTDTEPLSLPAEPAPAAAANVPLSIEDAIASEPPADSPVGELSFDEATSSSLEVGDVVEVPPAVAAHETAFAIVVPPMVIEPAPPEPPAVDETAVSVVLPEELLPTAEQPAAVAEAPVEPLPIEPSSAAEVAAATSLETVEPPPLPLNAPPVTTEADDESPSVVIPATPRKSKIIRDGFNRRSRRGRQPEPEASPFAAGGGSIAAPDPFGASPPADAFAAGSSVVDELSLTPPVAPPSEIAVPATEAVSDSVSELRPTRPTGREFRTAGPQTIRRDRPVATFGPDIAIPTAAVARPEDDHADLHELRRRRLKLIPLLLVLALFLAGGAMGTIWYLFPVYTEFETAIKFGNFEALTIKEQRDLQDEQLRLLRIDITRRNAVNELHARFPEIPNGFLASTVDFERAVMLSGWPESRKGDFVIRYRGTDPRDRQRVQALANTLYASNQSRVDNATRVRAALRDAQEKLDSNTRKLNDLKEQIEKERILGESRPKPGQVEEMQSAVLEAEKRWTDALAKLKDAQAEEARIDKLLHGAQDNPPAPPEKDEELARLTEKLTGVQAEYKALQTRQSEQAAVARGEIDTAMDAFQKQIEAARGQGAESPELINYIAAAENLQKTARELLGEMLDRQQSQYQQLSQLKASLDEKAQQRAIELRNSDPQLKEFYEKRELLRRQINAGVGSGVAKQELEPYEDQLKLTENMIKSREELLSSDPLHVETITSLQAMIDKMQADIVADRKKADEKMEELQRSFAASSPAVANLPEEQKKLADQVREQLGSITQARKRYADILEADRLAAEKKLKEMQGQIVALQGEVESRKQLLTDEFASKSVTALTTSLENQRKVVAEAQALESVVRAEFEAKGKELRTARDTLEALKNSDERMARLISEKETTEGLVATFLRDVTFRQDEAKRLLDIQPPPEDGVKEIEGKDPRPTYYLIALVSILALTAASVLWTLHSANRIEFEPVAEAADENPPAMASPKPVDPNAGEDTPAAIA